MSGRLGLRRCGMKLSKSLEEGICPPTRQGDRVQPAKGVLYHRVVAMSSKKGLELLGFGQSRLAGVRGRSAEEPIRQFGGTGSFRRLFSGRYLARESGTGAISLIWTAGDQKRTCPAFWPHALHGRRLKPPLRPLHRAENRSRRAISTALTAERPMHHRPVSPASRRCIVGRRFGMQSSALPIGSSGWLAMPGG